MKNKIKKTIFLTIISAISGSSFLCYSALPSNEVLPAFVETCKQIGLEKIQEQAKALGSLLQEETFEVCGVDSRWYNPSKYVWYCAEASLQDGSTIDISKIVQWSGGECH